MGRHTTRETQTTRITDEVVSEIARAASADARSVWKRLAGGELRRQVQQRIDSAIAARLRANSEPPSAA